MLLDEWTELAAQVKEHGPEVITFYLIDAGPNGEELELTLDDIRFTNGEIQVSLQ